MNYLFRVSGFFCIGHLAMLWLHPWVDLLYLYAFLCLPFCFVVFWNHYARHTRLGHLSISHQIRFFYRDWAPFIIGLGLGVAYGSWNLHLAVERRLPDAWHGQQVSIQGEVTSYPKVTDKKITFYFAPTCAINRKGDCIPLSEINRASIPLPAIGLMKVNLYQPYGAVQPHFEQPYSVQVTGQNTADAVAMSPLRLSPGELLELQLKLKSPRGLANQAGFDYGRWLMQAGVQALANGSQACFAKGACKRLEPVQGVWAIRLSIAKRIQVLFANFPKTQQFLSALLLADKTALEAPMQEAFTNLGLSHLLAISGLHIGMLAVIGFYMGQTVWGLVSGKLGSRYLGRLALVSKAGVCSFFSILFAAVYAGIAGFTVPTMRALLMLVISIVYINRNGKVPVLRLLVWSLLGVMLLQPLSPLGLGFWLSFVAVGLLGLVFAESYPRLPFVFGLLIAQLLLGLGMSLLLMPSGAWHPLSLLSNLLVIPALQCFILPGSLLLLSLQYLIDALSLPLSIEGLVLGFGVTVEWILIIIERTSVATSVLILNPLSSTFAVMALGLSLILWLVVRLRWLAYIIPPLLVVAFFSRVEGPRWGEAFVSVLDVGQGLAVVVETRSRVLVYDTGARYPSGWNAGDAVVLPYLRSRAIKQIDTLMISHMDNDHSGGAAALARQIPIGEVLIPPTAKLMPDIVLAEQTNLKRCAAIDRWEWEGVTFEVLSPAVAAANDKRGSLGVGRGSSPEASLDVKGHSNNFSCVLKITDEMRSYLLPGDIEARMEQQLLVLPKGRLAADVLLAPHHGSKTSSTTGLINRVNPSHVVFSAGFQNAFNHPHPDIVRRYQARDIAMLNTTTDGAIHWRAAENPLLIREHFDYAWY